MHAGVWRRKNAVDGARVQPEDFPKPLVGQVLLQPHPIELRELGYHEDTLRIASRDVKQENEIISDEANRGNSLLSGRMNRPWLVETPKVRLGPCALCQQVDFLERIHLFDYDLSDPAFCNYAERRGVLSLAGMPNSGRWRIFTGHQTQKSDYLADRYFQFAQEVEGARHRYSPEAMEANWRVICYGRAVLQDCWELYCVMRAGGRAGV